MRTVIFVDDSFTARPLKKLQEFCSRYKDEIGLPIFCQVSPLTVNAEIIETLLDAGRVKIVMGVETANNRIAELNNRSKSHTVTRKAIDLIESYRSQMKYHPTYQFIIDNPYETIDEMLETLKLAVSLPKPWDYPINSLMLFPGTPWYDKAIRKGILYDKSKQIYKTNWLDQSQPYFQLWIRLYRNNYPRFLLKAMVNPRPVRLACRS